MIKINEILSSPVPLDGKTIETKGIFKYGKELCAIYDNDGNSIWLVNPASASNSKTIKSANGKLVKVSGIFINKSKVGTGHFNQWSAELRNIEVFQIINREHSDTL